jgi:hypothetical protein
MGPIVTEVEDVDELLSGLEARDFQTALVDNRFVDVPFGVHDSDTSAIGKLEFMQV